MFFGRNHERLHTAGVRAGGPGRRRACAEGKRDGVCQSKCYLDFGVSDHSNDRFHFVIFTITIIATIHIYI